MTNARQTYRAYCLHFSRPISAGDFDLESLVTLATGSLTKSVFLSFCQVFLPLRLTDFDAQL